MVPEHIAEVLSRGKDYVIRSQPKGLPNGIVGLSSAVVTVALLLRWLRRERAWVVQVRTRGQDPFGDVLHQEEVAGDREARARVEALRRELRSGRSPAELADGL